MIAKAEEAATKIFGYQRLRPHQSEVLSHIFDGKDLIAILPTGSGKSLCYGLPASLRPGLVLVISPLIALMRDQVRRFTEVGLQCDWLDSLQSSAVKEQVMERLEKGATQILIISPERLAREDFRLRLRKLAIQLIAVDEAHCISQWGGHFRPDYRLLGQYLGSLGPCQKIALTATATEKVKCDIAEILSLQQPAVITGELMRENLKTKIVMSKNIEGQFQALEFCLSSENGPGIIYTPTRRLADEVYSMLKRSRISCALYHAGLPSAVRERTQQDFVQGRVAVVIATNAFGLGVDKADIRFVHHMGLPSSLEQYIQEIGRAGRDGGPARCYMFFTSRDYHVQKFMIQKSYPELSHLKMCLDLVKRGQGSHGLVEEEALGELRKATGLKDRDILQVFDILYRESLLSRMRPMGASVFGEQSQTVIFEGHADEAQVFRTYPERKKLDLGKLEIMRAFAEADERERPRIVSQYFGQKESAF